MYCTSMRHTDSRQRERASLLGQSYCSKNSGMRLQKRLLQGSRRGTTDVHTAGVNITGWLHEGGGLVDKVVSMGSGRNSRVCSSPIKYDLETMPYVEWFSMEGYGGAPPSNDSPCPVTSSSIYPSSWRFEVVPPRPTITWRVLYIAEHVRVSEEAAEAGR
ncbi:hypothetical protein E2C01_025450 [Portunus trituberculatus]|uniref:Uncharacterized protein n=1 Tax=Portunus trituberculatus TaxID=210409 RepID=A0A5B7EFJ9_PORTR|nr:hypothetical protein [Portunus trituberculatus]